MKVSTLRKRLKMPRSVFSNRIGATERTVITWEGEGREIDDERIQYRFRAGMKEMKDGLTDKHA